MTPTPVSKRRAPLDYLKFEEAYTSLHERWLWGIYSEQARRRSAVIPQAQVDVLLPLMRRILLGMCTYVQQAPGYDWQNLANVIGLVGVPPFY